MSDLSVTRTERKFVIGKFQAEKIFNRLLKALPGDPFAGNEPYFVRSLYFDSYYNDDYFDKLDGIKNRKKIRIRTYNRSDDIIKLELKQKSGDAQHKKSYSISKQQVKDMCSGRYEFLLHSGDPHMEQIYYIMKKEVYRPKCIIEYQRRAFAVPTNDIRITFDTDICTSEGNLDLFADKNCFRPSSAFDLVVLEVKYNRFLLSYVKDLLKMDYIEETSYSKYTTGRMQLF
ncbi:MAG: polyphosphate polymerase domain-containing protein [Lachnospiraceae bacterium]|jgi:hypothetical protein|nr:polyphosphate polymerase domain-containing protein [Lachnospiraceae bacterium]